MRTGRVAQWTASTTTIAINAAIALQKDLGRKVVLVHDPEFLAPKKARGDGLAKSREAWRAGRRKEAARRLAGRRCPAETRSAPAPWSRLEPPP